MKMQLKHAALAAALLGAALGQDSIAQTGTGSALGSVVASYLDLKNALTRDDGDSARIAGRNLQKEIHNVAADSLTPTDRLVWTKYQKDLIQDADEIAASEEIDGLRIHFQSLSATMYECLKRLKINTVDLYYQYCPMAKAYWLSENAKIVNPYQGQKMLTCGSNKDTLKAGR